MQLWCVFFFFFVVCLARALLYAGGAPVVLMFASAAQDVDEPFGEYTKGHAPCACARALCAALNVGEPMQRCEEAAIGRFLHPTGAGRIDSASLEEGILRVQLQLDGKEALVLKLPDGEWGLLTHYSPTDPKPMRCHMCPHPFRCPHVSAMDSGEAGSTQSSMTQQAYVSMMEKHLDPATGRERVTSISQHRVPEGKKKRKKKKSGVDTIPTFSPLLPCTGIGLAH